MRFLTGPVIAALFCLPASGAPETLTLARSDGSLIHYTLDRPEGPRRGLLLIAQGSGCLPGAANPALATVRAAFPHYAALIVEKAGVTPDAAISDGSRDCPAEYVERYTMSQRMEDYRIVLAALGAEADPLVLYGGSEGGLAVAKLAAELHPAATVLMSSGTGLPLGDMILTTVPPEGQSMLKEGFAAARAAPESSELFAGSTYRFWADILDDRSLDHMLAGDGPFLLIQGGRDVSNPVAAARMTADAFAAAGRCGLTYWEFPALDHGMVAPDGVSQLGVVAELAADWVEGVKAC
ncbi:hypothetical protein DMC47_13370 [Nostoc sp. 3335mG]|nr:hypothetical protein DMC47_13370 [Nostoc sp. 3335mG]